MILSSIFSGVAVAAVAAFVNNAPAMLEQRLKMYEPENKSQVATDGSSRSVLQMLSTKKIMSEKELRRFAEAVKVCQLDSIVGSTDNGTQKSQRQYFIYDENKLPMKRINSYWNPSTENWDPAEYYDFVWNEDGYCLVQAAYNENAGQKYEFEYNERKLGIVQILSVYENGKWIPQQRGDYKYDDAGNIIEEMVSQWNAASSEWEQVVKNVAVWDNLKRQTEFASYQWDGTAWTGNGEKKVFQYPGDAKDRYVLNGWYVWDEETSDWFWYMKREFEWNADNQLVCQTESYFNKDTGAWDGCYEWYNKKMYNKQTVINYDAKKRITDETYSEAHEIGAFTAMSDIIRDWTDLEDGASQEVITTRALRSNREPWAENIVLQDSTIKRYNPAGLETYMEEWHVRGASGPLYRYQKTEKSYDSNGYLASEYTYSQNRQNPDEWLGVTGIDYTRDKDGNVLEQLSVKWQSADSVWVYNNRFVNKYDNGCQIEQLAYRWRDEKWTPNYGTGQFYDFNVKVGDIVLWPGADFEYKLNEVRSYTGDGDDWTYMANVYHYSEIKEGGVGEVADSDVRISYDGNAVCVSGEGDVMTRIFDAAGRSMVATTAKTIDVSGFAEGLYVVRSSDAVKKIMK